MTTDLPWLSLILWKIDGINLIWYFCLNCFVKILMWNLMSFC